MHFNGCCAAASTGYAGGPKLMTPAPLDARAATKNDTFPLLGPKLGAPTVRANSISCLQGEGVGSPGCFPRPQSDDGGMWRGVVCNAAAGEMRCWQLESCSRVVTATLSVNKVCEILKSINMWTGLS